MIFSFNKMGNRCYLCCGFCLDFWFYFYFPKSRQHIKNHMVFETLAKRSFFSYDTVNNIYTPKACPHPHSRLVFLRQQLMNRINSKGRFVKNDQMER